MLLLTTKFHVPQVQNSHLARQRLIDQLEAGVRGGRRLSLLVAPAGFGKTTLVTTWLAAYPHRVAWLALDPNDRQIARFLYYLVTSLKPHLPGLEADILGFDQGGQEPPVELILTSILNATALLDAPVVLVLEDYHETGNRQVDHAVAFLLDHLSPNLHIVITSREDPMLPLSRLRVRDQLTEIRAEDLRFNRPEVAAFLENSSDVNLTSPQIAVLEERTEGWIAGLQLAVLSLKGHRDAGQFIAGFGGSHRYIMDYLVDEVLDRQPEHLRQFLLQTALLRRMNAELCNRLLDRHDAGQTLEKLETANLFIVPLDNRREWYRYHHLFAELLLFRLNHNFSAEVADMHYRAGKWFAEHGLWDEAVYHLNHSHRVADLEELLTAAIEANTRYNQPNLVLPWFENIPEETLKQRSLLALHKSWALALAGQSELSAEYAALAQKSIGPESSRLERGLLEAIQAYNARFQLDVAGSLAHGSAALELMAWVSPVIHNIMQMLLGQVKLLVPPLADEGMQQVKDALSNARKIGNSFGLFQSLSTIIFMLIAQARLREAGLVLDQYDKEAETSGSDKIGATNLYWLHTLRGTLYYLTNDLAAAQAQISRVIRDEQTDGFEWQSKAWAFVMQAILYQAEGKFDPALAIFRRIEAAGVELPPTIGAVPFMMTLLLQMGELAEPAEWVKSLGLSPSDPVSPFNEDFYLCYVRILTVQKRYDDALAVLINLENLESSLGNNYRLAIVRVQQAIVYKKLGQLGTAKSYLTKAIHLAAPPKLYRAFLDEEASVFDLLTELRSVSPEFVANLTKMYRRPEPEKQEVSPTDSSLLSQRELEILGLIAGGMSNKDIGDKLFLATGTVKRHAANIFGKLDVNSRTGAIARARELGLFT